MEQSLEQLHKKTVDDLLAQKALLEEQIRHLERKDIEDRIRDMIPAVHDLNHAITNMQNQLNLIWKRTQQLTNDMREILDEVMPELRP